MKIQTMFQKDINRDINGVIKVTQNDELSLVQELGEYIITKELRRHFNTFFENYSKSIDTPTDKIGVWISGFFGSGKGVEHPGPPFALDLVAPLSEGSDVEPVRKDLPVGPPPLHFPASAFAAPVKPHHSGRPGSVPEQYSPNLAEKQTKRFLWLP